MATESVNALDEVLAAVKKNPKDFANLLRNEEFLDKFINTIVTPDVTKFKEAYEAVSFHIANEPDISALALDGFPKASLRDKLNNRLIKKIEDVLGADSKEGAQILDVVDPRGDARNAVCEVRSLDPSRYEGKSDFAENIRNSFNYIKEFLGLPVDVTGTEISCNAKYHPKPATPDIGKAGNGPAH